MISNREIEEILEQHREATGDRWFWNSYSGIQCVLPDFESSLLTDSEDETDGEPPIATVAYIAQKPGDEGRGDLLHNKESAANARLIENYRNQMRRVVERLRRCEKALRWYANATNYTAVARYSDNAYACPIADDDGTRARAYFSEVDGGEG